MSGNHPGIRSAAEVGLIGCHVCGEVCRTRGPAVGRCPRCGAALRRRKALSVARTWALLIAAVILYIPANVVPVMQTSSLFSSTDSTILSGVQQLWLAGSPGLAVIVFFASIMVPVLKFLALGWLLIGLRLRHPKPPRQRARLYRLVEALGYWSMLDVFVVTLLVGAVQLAPLASIRPLPGIVWFALVVVLTMLASKSFDPRLIWDAATRKSADD